MAGDPDSDSGTDAEPPTDPDVRSGPARWQVVALAVALCFLAGVAGWWIGQRDDSESFNAADVGFLADMSVHHDSAIALSLEQLGRGTDPLIDHFARDILVSQAQEIAVMNILLEESGDRDTIDDEIAMGWMGHPVARSAMPGLPTEAELDAFAAATGTAVDDQFSTLMIRHHAAGAAMAEHAARDGESARVRRLARAMARVQRTEINEINTRRVALGLPKVEVDGLESLETADSHSH